MDPVRIQCYQDPRGLEGGALCKDGHDIFCALTTGRMRSIGDGMVLFGFLGVDHWFDATSCRILASRGRRINFMNSAALVAMHMHLPVFYPCSTQTWD